MQPVQDLSVRRDPIDQQVLEVGDGSKVGLARIGVGAELVDLCARAFDLKAQGIQIVAQRLLDAAAALRGDADGDESLADGIGQFGRLVAPVRPRCDRQQRAAGFDLRAHALLQVRGRVVEPEGLGDLLQGSERGAAVGVLGQ